MERPGESPAFFKRLKKKMTEGPDFANYVRCMEEIKRRQFAVEEILDRKTTSFQYTNVEFVALQFGRSLN
jgi:hypothetical protein